MTKIEETLCKHFELIYLNGTKCEPELEFLEEAVSTGLDYETLIEAMKEYTDYQVEKFKKNLINCAYYQENSHVVDVSLILGIDLPEHE